jgi:hypothetical protein
MFLPCLSLALLQLDFVGWADGVGSLTVFRFWLFDPYDRLWKRTGGRSPVIECLDYTGAKICFHSTSPRF